MSFACKVTTFPDIPAVSVEFLALRGWERREKEGVSLYGSTFCSYFTLSSKLSYTYLWACTGPPLPELCRRLTCECSSTTRMLGA